MGNYMGVPRFAHNDAYLVFRTMLSDLRRKKGVTQEALAALLGVPQSYVSKYELGERRIDLVETVEILRALEIDPAKFVRKLIKTVQSQGVRTIVSPRNSPHGRR
jgi:transcriptional regulator with XRE-family HTH domain